MKTSKNNSWSDNLKTRFLFFTGKGGVGKTSLASALAVKLADAGKRVLIISTDPASNLDEVFVTKLNNQPTLVTSVKNLSALNINPEDAAKAYREKMLAPYRGKLPEAILKNIEEQFSGSCTTEIAAFDEFVKLLSNQKLNEEYDHLIFDTAPTGHTLRLLSLPGAWTSYLNTTTAESSCLGPLSGLQEQKENYQKAIQELSDPSRCTIVLVARADNSSLKEAARAQVELSEIGLKNLNLIINAVFTTESSDKIAQAFAKRISEALANIPKSLNEIPQFQVPLLLVNTVGIDALRELAAPQSLKKVEGIKLNQELPLTKNLDNLVTEISAANHGVILTMGKGGVGKTYIAVEIATRLANLGKKVLLTTTDPAGNLIDFAKASDNLQIDKIDAQKEIKKYTDEAISRSSSLDAEALELLKEDLRSPCTEEIAVFRAFAEIVSKGKDQFVVIDTAPTGHTILLMDATESYHREVLRTNSNAPDSVRNLLPLLRDENFSKVILVTLPEPTPVHEAAKLQEDLNRAGIKPFAWVINRSLLASGTTDNILLQRANKEITCIDEVMLLGDRVVVTPWVTLN